MGALGCTQRTRGRRRVGSALEWQGGRRVREKEEREKEREKRENAESDNAVEGSEEYFDESEHVDGSLKRSVLQTARMGLVRRWMRFRE